MSKLAKDIVAAIEYDFTDRRGLRQEWEGIDDDIQQDIRDEWERIIDNVLKNNLLEDNIK